MMLNATSSRPQARLTCFSRAGRAASRGALSGGRGGVVMRGRYGAAAAGTSDGRLPRRADRASPDRRGGARSTLAVGRGQATGADVAQVGAEPAIEGVRAVAAVEEVVAVVAAQSVVAVEPGELVATRAAADHVRASVAGQGVIAAATDDVLDVRA